MNDNLDEVRRDIENTRHALGEKIQKLDHKIQTMKNTTLNPAYHVRRRPWPILAGIALAGCFVGRSLRSKPRTLSRGNGLISGMAGGFASAVSSSVGVMMVDFIRHFLRDRKHKMPQ